MSTALIALIVDWTLRLIVAAIVIARAKSSSGVRWAWLLVILTLPYLGFALYLCFGEIWKGQGRLAKHRRIIRRVRTSATRDKASAVVLGNDFGKLGHLAQHAGNFAPRPGNHAQLYSDTLAAIQRLESDINAATQTCHLLFYIWLDDNTGRRIGQALIRAAARGVQCRVMVDAMGSSRFLGTDLCRSMRAGGVQVVPAMPYRLLSMRLDHRNHRKIAVIDGRIGWTGSQNIADASFAIKPKFAPWVDVLVRLEGPIVGDLQTLFVEDWILETNQEESDRWSKLLASSPAPSGKGAVMQLYGSGPTEDTEILRELTLVAMLTAERELIITTPYFVPDVATVTALRSAARSGIEAKLVVPQRNDSFWVGSASRSYYDGLLDAGVKIYEYQPGLLHAKTYTIDGELSIVATANLDRRSFELNYELSLLIVDSGFTDSLRQVQLSYIAESNLVSSQQWSARPWPQRLTENVARMFAPLL